MNPRLAQPWIPVSKIQELVQLEPALMILGLAIASWVAYKMLLRKLSSDRHRNLNKLFKNLGFHVALGTTFFLAYTALLQFSESNTGMAAMAGRPAYFERLLSYFGLLTILAGAVVTVKVSRILLFEYLFFRNMHVAVPLLLVNLFTLLLSITLTGWVATEIFSVRLAPLLATSAIFSLVLGLALQDTLGNLFAGVALQFDKPYEIGDWIEIQTGSQKWVGQVEEISWRATLLIGFADELVTVPNRVMAQAQVSNFSPKGKPILRNQIFRIPFGTSPDRVRTVLLDAISKCPMVRQDAKAFVVVSETTESWVTFKLIYFIDNYGTQFLAADQVIRTVLERFESAGIELATQKLQLQDSITDSAACNEVS